MPNPPIIVYPRHDNDTTGRLLLAEGLMRAADTVSEGLMNYWKYAEDRKAQRLNAAMDLFKDPDYEPPQSAYQILSDELGVKFDRDPVTGNMTRPKSFAGKAKEALAKASVARAEAETGVIQGGGEGRDILLGLRRAAPSTEEVQAEKDVANIHAGATLGAARIGAGATIQSANIHAATALAERRLAEDERERTARRQHEEEKWKIRKQRKIEASEAWHKRRTPEARVALATSKAEQKKAEAGAASAYLKGAETLQSFGMPGDVYTAEEEERRAQGVKPRTVSEQFAALSSNRERLSNELLRYMHLDPIFKQTLEMAIADKNDELGFRSYIIDTLATKWMTDPIFKPYLKELLAAEKGKRFSLRHPFGGGGDEELISLLQSTLDKWEASQFGGGTSPTAPTNMIQTPLPGIRGIRIKPTPTVPGGG